MVKRAAASATAALAALSVLAGPCSAFQPQPPRSITGRRSLPPSPFTPAARRRPRASPAPLLAEVVTVGDALFDCIAETDTADWELDRVLEEERWTAWPGGAPANVATALRKLGTASGFAGCIGSDADGDELAALFGSIGVDTSLLQRSDEAPTRRVVVTRDADMVPTFACFVNKRPAKDFADCLFDLTPEALSPAALDAGLKGCRWVCSSTLSLAFPKSQRSVRHLVDAAVEQGARKFVDINWRDVFWPDGMEDFARDEILDFARDADVIKLTDDEAEWLFEIEPAAAFSDPQRVHGKFPKAKAVLITSGAKGVSYSMLGQVGTVPAFEVDVVETTGAGDAFTAGFLHGVLAMDIDFDMFETLVPKNQRPLLIQLLMTFAVAVAGLTCMGEGAIAPQPSYETVESFMVEYEATRRVDDDEDQSAALGALEGPPKTGLGEWKPKLGG